MGKHQRNKRNKIGRLLRKKQIRCSKCGTVTADTCCGPLVKVGEPGYDEALANAKPVPGISYSYRPIIIPPVKKVVPKNYIDPEKWAEDIRNSLETFPGVPHADTIIYRGRSGVFGTKAGKRKIKEGLHRYDIISSYEIPHKGRSVNLWHGSKLANVPSILEKGLRVSFGGMLGRGVYLGDKKKAINYALGIGSQGAMFLVEAKLGKVKAVDDVNRYHLHRQLGDTLHAGRNVKGAWGYGLRNPEWCVRDASRLKILEVHVVPRILRK